MGNLALGFKKFLQNKNTVTIVGVVLAIFVLYFAYTMRIKSAINPISVPYATEQILSATQITEDKIAYRLIPPSMLDENVIRNKADIVDKYVAIDTIIPKGSLFYKRAVVERSQLPDDIILDSPQDEVLFLLSVDINSTYGNAIIPGSFVDIYFSAHPSLDNKTDVILGKLIANVKVLAVKDANGRPVFQNMEEKRVPSMIIFSLKKEYFELLTGAQKLKSYDANIWLVPSAETYKAVEDQGKTELSSKELQAWINSHVQYK